MYEPLHPIRAEKRGKGRVRLHLKGEVKISDILEVAGARAGWICPEGGWVELYPSRAKRKREVQAEGPLKEILSLGPDRTLPLVKRTETRLEFAGVEKFRLQRGRGILGFTCDFSLGLLYKPHPTAPRRRLHLAKRAPGPETTPSDRAPLR